VQSISPLSASTSWTFVYPPITTGHSRPCYDISCCYSDYGLHNFFSFLFSLTGGVLSSECVLHNSHIPMTMLPACPLRLYSNYAIGWPIISKSNTIHIESTVQTEPYPSSTQQLTPQLTPPRPISIHLKPTTLVLSTPAPDSACLKTIVG